MLRGSRVCRPEGFGFELLNDEFPRLVHPVVLSGDVNLYAVEASDAFGSIE